MAKEQNIIDILRAISSGNDTVEIHFDDESLLEVNPDMAQSVLDLYDVLDETDQIVFVEKCSYSADDFIQVLDDYREPERYRDEDSEE